jgi:hypothetical protein
MLLALNGIHCDLQLSGGVKKGPLEVKKEQNPHCTKVTFTGVNWGVSKSESVCIVVPALRLVHSRKGSLLAPKKLTILWYLA